MTTIKRSELMSRIRRTNTKPEIIVRGLISRSGFRYRLQSADLPGRPDLKISSASAVVFVNGCFWHGHDCGRVSRPKSNRKFWNEKIERNIARDARDISACAALGWRVLVIWECALTGKHRWPEQRIQATVAKWLRRDHSRVSVRHIKRLPSKE